MVHLAFRCPLCEGPFQVAAEHQGLAVTCPHCGRAVEIPQAPPVAGRAGPAPVRPPLVLSHAAAGRVSQVSADLQQWAGAGGELPIRDPELRVQEHGGTRKVVAIGGQAYEIHRLTPEERRAFRRRVNLWIFGVSAALLLVTALMLLLWRG